MNLESQIKVSTLEPHHIMSVGHFVPMGYNESEYAWRLANVPNSYVATLNGSTLLMAGIFPLWHGVGEAWAFITIEARQRPFWLHKTAKRILNEIMQRDNFHRIHAHACADNKVDINWLEKLGFEYEGLMRKYTPDKKDMLRYSKTELFV